MDTITDTTTIRIGQHTGAVRALSGAFLDDPVFRWIYPDDERRAAVLSGFFELFTRAIGRHGVSHEIGDGLGAALWVPPGEELADDEEAFGAAVAELSPPDVDRLMTCFELLSATHPHEPCWYLNFLGVAPDHQGRGVGSALLRAGIERSERDGVPLYLEATSPQNRRLYERHGFVTTAGLLLPGGPPLWAMWRPPC
jgi:ribosomal protein S18 acetylase RimI-like enzyme